MIPIAEIRKLFPAAAAARMSNKELEVTDSFVVQDDYLMPPIIGKMSSGGDNIVKPDSFIGEIISSPSSIKFNRSNLKNGIFKLSILP